MFFLTKVKQKEPTQTHFRKAVLFQYQNQEKSKGQRK